MLYLQHELLRRLLPVRLLVLLEHNLLHGISVTVKRLKHNPIITNASRMLIEFLWLKIVA